MKNVTKQIEIRANRLNADKNVLGMLDPAFKWEFDILKFNAHNTLEHHLAMCKVCYQLKKEGRKFITEAIFKSGLRADIFIPDESLVIEVLCSETMQQFNKKKDKYLEKHIDLEYMFGYRVEDILKEGFLI